MQPKEPEEFGEAKGLTDLPNEILFQIISCWSPTCSTTACPATTDRGASPRLPLVLEPSQSTSLQLVSKKLLEICRHNAFWRSQCFESSTFLESLHRRQRLLGRLSEPSDSADAPAPDQGSVLGRPDIAPSRRNERLRIMANWDPSFPGENVNWYDEYIQRNAPTTVNWLQQPVLRDGVESTYIETRGVALYTPENGQQDHQGLETVFAVSNLDDGSVCMWDITGTKGRKGAICARSRPGILYVDGPSADNSSRSKRIDSGVTECVSVDSKLHLAFFAVQNREFAHLCALSVD